MSFNGEERRKHPEECLRQEEWGMIKAFVVETKNYRKSLCSKLNFIRNTVIGLVLAILIPFILGMISVGEMRQEIRTNSEDIKILKERVFYKS